MAIRWGGTSNHFRLGYDTITSGSSLTVILYGQSVGYGHNWTYPVSLGGSWSGSVSFSFYSGFGATVTKEITRRTFTGYGTRAFSASLSGFGASSISFSVTTKSPVARPGAPANLRLTDNNVDTRRHTLAWDAVSGATSYSVQQSWLNGAWTRISTVSGTSATITSRTNNGSYRYRVYATNAGGNSSYSNIILAYTRPNAPGVPSLTVLGGATVEGTVGLNGVYYASGLEVERSDSLSWLVGSGTGGRVDGFTDANAAGVGIQYRARRFVGAAGVGRIFGPWSGWSAKVTAISPPNAPNVLAPTGTQSAGGPLTFVWVHNPADATEQTAAEVRYRPNLVPGVWTFLSVAGSAQSLTLDSAQLAGLVAAGPAIDFEVRTRGLHTEYGAWSTTSVFVVADPPSATVLAPEAGDYTAGAVTVQWATGQADGLPQSGWRAVLFEDGVEVERKSGSNQASQATFAYRLLNDTDYSVMVEVATSGIWSQPETVEIHTAFVPPEPPIITGRWDEDLGAHIIEIEAGDWPTFEVGYTEAVTVDELRPDTAVMTLQRSIDGGARWEPIETGLTPIEGQPLQVVDREGLSSGETIYRATAYTDLEAEAAADTVVESNSPNVWLGSAPAYIPVGMKRRPSTTESRTPSHQHFYVFAGRDTEEEIGGTGMRRTINVTAMLLPKRVAPTEPGRDDIMKHAIAPEGILHRDPTGRRVYGSIEGMSVPEDHTGMAQVSYTVRETSRNSDEADYGGY